MISVGLVVFSIRQIDDDDDDDGNCTVTDPACILLPISPIPIQCGARLYSIVVRMLFSRMRIF